MPKHAVARLFLAVFLFLGAVSAAAETVPAPLPYSLAMRVSIRSVNQLLEKLDLTVAEISRKTRYEMPSGFLPIILAMYMPLPATSWDMDRGLDILVTKPVFGGSLVCFFEAESLDAFLEALKEDGIEVGPCEEFDIAYKIELPNLGSSYLAGMPNGRLAIASSPAGLVLALTTLHSWTPAFWGEGDMTLEIDLEPDWTERVKPFREIRRAVAELARVRGQGKMDSIDQIAQYGVNPQVVKGMMEWSESFLPAALDEIGKARQIALDVGFGEDRLGFAWRFGFESPSIAGRIAAAAMNRSNVDSPMLKYVGADAVALCLNAPMEEILPGVGQMLVDAFGQMEAKSFPSFNGKMTALLAEAVANQAGDSLAAGYREPREKNVAWVAARDADKLLGTQTEVIDLFNAMVEDTVLEPDYRFSFQREGGKTAGGVDYLKMRLVANNPDKIDSLLAALPGPEGDNLRRAFDKLWGTVYYVGAKNGVMISVAGEVDEDDFVAALAAMDGQANPLVDTAAARDALAGLRSVQSSLFLVNMDNLVEYMIREVAKASPSREEVAALEYMLEPGANRLVVTDDILGASLGAAGNMLSIETSLPLSSLNAVIRNYEKLLTVMNAGPDGEEEEEECLDEEDEEDIELDEPAGAA